MNKLRAFLLRKFAHAAIAAGPSTFDMAEVLDNGGLCLARLPKGILGEETAQLVGSFIVARTWQAAARRARHCIGPRAPALDGPSLAPKPLAPASRGLAGSAAAAVKSARTSLVALARR